MKQRTEFVATVGDTEYHLLDTAHFLAERALAAEAEPPGRNARHGGAFSYAFGSVLASACFLEGTANTAWEYLATGGAPRKHWPAKHHLFQRFKDIGVLQQARLSSLDKFDLALVLSGVAALKHGETPYQDVRLLLDWRNALVHFTPSWYYTREALAQFPSLQQTEKRLVKGLQSRLGFRGRHPTGLPYFPSDYLSGKAAVWAFQAVAQFVGAFYAALPFRLFGARAFEHSVRSLQPFRTPPPRRAPRNAAWTRKNERS
jgi:hypothetical protein